MSALPHRAPRPLKDGIVDERICATFGSRTLGDYRKPTWACTSPVQNYVEATSSTCTGRGEGAASVETARNRLREAATGPSDSWICSRVVTMMWSIPWFAADICKGSHGSPLLSRSDTTSNTTQLSLLVPCTCQLLSHTLQDWAALGADCVLNLVGL